LEDERPVRVAQARAFVRRDVCALMIPHRSRAVNHPQKDWLARSCAPSVTLARSTRASRGGEAFPSLTIVLQVSTTLQMPNEFIGQNGDEIRQVTPIVVTGCPPAHGKAAVKHKQKKKKKGKAKGKR